MSLSQGSNVSKLFQIVNVTISQNEFLLHTFVQLILHRLITFNKTSVTKTVFKGHNVSQKSLVNLTVKAACC